MQRTKLTWLLPLLLIVLHALQADAQTPVDSLKPDYLTPTEYEVGGIDFVGLKRYNKDILLSLIGLDVGDKVEVPSEKLADIIDYLWKQNLFSDVKLNVDSIVRGKIYLSFVVEEIPYQAGPVRLKGISKAEANKLATKLKPYATGTISQQHILSITTLISDYYKEKGYYNVFVSTRQVPDNADTNLVQLIADITTGPRVKINSIDIVGNRAISDTKLRRVMKDTKERRWYNIFKASKFNAEAYKKDKQRIIDYYNQQGFRDAEVVKDSVYLFSPKRLNISITIDEHKVYYFGDITWIGNTKYSTDTLNRVLGIKRGEVYDNSKLNESLYMNATGSDITSLYMDNGYLFFNVVPVETGLNGDTINLEMHIHEGRPATIGGIKIKGNTRTQDHVIIRELYTKPGQLFRRSDLILSQQALIRLGYFNPEAIQINPIPDPVNGTVDIEYTVEEKPTDQIQLSGGIAAGKVVGTLSLVMNNFSFRNIVKKDGWRPLPAGDGQRVAISAQSNGPSFQSYSLSVTEPWLGGKKPNSLTGNVLYNSQRYSGDRKFSALGVSLGLGNRWKRPDNFFSSFYTLNFYKYYAKDFPGIDFNGNRYDVNIGLSVSRNSLDGKDYPMEGSSFTLGVQATPPWSGSRAFTSPPQLVEYHKWNFDALWYQKVVGKLVFKASASVGYLGYYNKNLGLAPVNRFYMGGVQLAASSFVGQEYVNMRGYENGSLSPTEGSALYNRFVLELRYPLLLKPQMGVNIYGLAFAEAGNVWNGIKEYNPSVMKRSAGAGIRVVLPMFGLIGMDAGYGFDTKSIPGYTSSPWQFHFVIGKDIK
jgi:outer membrane protein insertion porin family